jgi:hypothetical protein
MSQYPNTLGVIIANGAISTIYLTALAPIIKTGTLRAMWPLLKVSLGSGNSRLDSTVTSKLVLGKVFDYFTGEGMRDD